MCTDEWILGVVYSHVKCHGGGVEVIIPGREIAVLCTIPTITTITTIKYFDAGVMAT